MVWATTGADVVTVGPSGRAGVPGRPDGRAVVCAPANTSFVLTAVGPGGTSSSTVQGRGPDTGATPTMSG